jgi:hypothetical protein
MTSEPPHRGYYGPPHPAYGPPQPTNRTSQTASAPPPHQPAFLPQQLEPPFTTTTMTSEPPHRGYYGPPQPAYGPPQPTNGPSQTAYAPPPQPAASFLPRFQSYHAPQQPVYAPPQPPYAPQQVIFYPPPSTQQAVFVFTPPPVLAFYQLGYGPPAQPSFLPSRLAPQPAFAPPHSYYYAQRQTVRYQFSSPPH